MNPFEIPEVAKFTFWLLIEIFVVIKLFRIIERD
jgi:hypothetical protein